jgi:hypothetical protein
MVQSSITGPAPQVQPMVASSGPTSALVMTALNQQNASKLQELAGGFKRRSRRRRRSTRTKRYKTKGRKRLRRTKRSTKRSRKLSRMYRGGATPIPYSVPTGSNTAVLNISEELALAHASANVNAKFDNAARNAPTK